MYICNIYVSAAECVVPHTTQVVWTLASTFSFKITKTESLHFGV